MRARNLRVRSSISLALSQEPMCRQTSACSAQPRCRLPRVHTCDSGIYDKRVLTLCCREKRPLHLYAATYSRQPSLSMGKLKAHMCRRRVHRDTEHGGWNMHAAAALVQALRPQEDYLPGPPKGPPQPPALSIVHVSCTSMRQGHSHSRPCEQGVDPGQRPTVSFCLNLNIMALSLLETVSAGWCAYITGLACR